MVNLRDMMLIVPPYARRVRGMNGITPSAEVSPG
jgi:hypothetical protein